MDAHRLVVEELLDSQLADRTIRPGPALARFDLLDGETLRAGDLGLDTVAREQCRAVFARDVADERVDLARMSVVAFARFGPTTDVLQTLDPPVFEKRREPPELFESVPAALLTPVGLAFELGDDGLGDIDARPGERTVFDPSRDAAVDDYTRIRYDIHTETTATNHYKALERPLSIPHSVL